MSAALIFTLFIKSRSWLRAKYSSTLRGECQDYSSGLRLSACTVVLCPYCVGLSGVREWSRRTVPVCAGQISFRFVPGNLTVNANVYLLGEEYHQKPSKRMLTAGHVQGRETHQSQKHTFDAHGGSVSRFSDKPVATISNKVKT